MPTFAASRFLRLAFWCPRPNQWRNATATLPHAVSFLQDNMQMASLDHAMWFHRPFRADEWLLYVQDSPSASGSRGFNRGLIYNKAGDLVASTTQEGLMRLHD